MTLQLPRVMAVSPSGRRDPGVVVAACRAGALGILDLGFVFRFEADLGALQRTSKFLKGQTFGVRRPAGAVGETVVADLPADLNIVVVAESGGEDWGRLRAILSGSGRIPVAEVTTRASCRAAASAGFAALIVA